MQTEEVGANSKYASAHYDNCSESDDGSKDVQECVCPRRCTTSATDHSRGCTGRAKRTKCNKVRGLFEVKPLTGIRTFMYAMKGNYDMVLYSPV